MDKDTLVTYIKLGETYHVSWANRGIMGICTRIYFDEGLVQLKRPKNKVPFKNLIPWADLRYTNTQLMRMEKKGFPHPDRTNDLRHQKRMKKFNLL